MVNDLMADVESKFPVAAGRATCAIVGVFMGGFGAVKLALSHPNLFVFATGISPAIDVPNRPFSIKRISQWRHHSSISDLGEARPGATAIHLYLLAPLIRRGRRICFSLAAIRKDCFPANRNVAALLAQRHLRYEFYVVQGGHDWNQWNRTLPRIFQSLFGHLARTPND
jgi:S-formylglutathione hydrolase FrmB